jgi:hypothetical protein
MSEHDNNKGDDLLLQSAQDLCGKQMIVEKDTVGWYEVPIADTTIHVRVLEVTEPHSVPCGVRTLFGNEYGVRIVCERVQNELFKGRKYIFWTIPGYSAVRIYADER